MVPHQKNSKPFGARKQWKLLSEYAVARDGDPAKMHAGDILHENGPSVGEFLIRHYVSRCVMPAIKPSPKVAQPIPPNSPVAPPPEPLTPVPESVKADEIGDVVVTPLRVEKRKTSSTDLVKKTARVAPKKIKTDDPVKSIVI